MTVPAEWLDKLEIREMIERSMRYIDDQAGQQLAGRARITLMARYRDRLRRGDDGRWVITNRTGVSIARPGEAGTDTEWSRALDRMPDEMRARFPTD